MCQGTGWKTGWSSEYTFPVRVPEPGTSCPEVMESPALETAKSHPDNPHLSRGLEKVTFTGAFPQPLLGCLTGFDTAKPAEGSRNNSANISKSE